MRPFPIGRSAARGSRRRNSNQQAQFLQVQGLHLQPPRVSSLAAWVASSVWVGVMVILLWPGQR